MQDHAVHSGLQLTGGQRGSCPHLPCNYTRRKVLLIVFIITNIKLITYCSLHILFGTQHILVSCSLHHHVTNLQSPLTVQKILLHCLQVSDCNDYHHQLHWTGQNQASNPENITHIGGPRVQVGDVFPPTECGSSRHFIIMSRASAFGRREHIPHLHPGLPIYGQQAGHADPPPPPLKKFYSYGPVHGTLHCSWYSIAPTTIICKFICDSYLLFLIPESDVCSFPLYAPDNNKSSH